jgi:hypothetical protein
MCLVRRGVYPVDWDPLTPSGDRNTSGVAFSDFWTYEDTLAACHNPKVHCEWTKVGQPHAPGMWESGGTSGTY